MRRGHRRAHRLIWRILLIVLTFIVLLAFWMRRNTGVETPPVRLEAPQ